jgi:ABC-2 type transport system ATP-binding protein
VIRLAGTEHSAIRTSGPAECYYGRPALRGIDLNVPPGVVFGCLGPSGAGKTATIRLLVGLVRRRPGGPRRSAWSSSVSGSPVAR